MLSKAQSKYIRSLSQQKYRNENKAFLVEGDKIVKEWLSAKAKINYLLGLESWIEENRALLSYLDANVIIVEEHELKAVSALKTPNKVLAVATMPDVVNGNIADGWVLALEHIQDPGNMGTIMRIADWFGINNIVCSDNCVDIYNPKVVQAAMGAHLRVNTVYTNINNFIKETKLTTYAATLTGDNIKTIDATSNGVIIIGNESKGISDELIQLADKQITISKKGGAESLNAAVSAGIIVASLVS